MSKANPVAKRQIIPRPEHNVSRQLIDANAIKVLYRLKACGFDAYLVGGCVRDLLLGHSPKDFDIATNAKPEEVKQIFRNCRLIGRRFRLAHILFGNRTVVEVATFRAHHDNAPSSIASTHQGMIVRDNVYGTIEEDAIRRDFTINALYYNIKDFSILDFTQGVKDLQDKKLRIIGDATQRYQEDPVRMIRAVRIASKLGLTIVPETASPIFELKELLYQVSSSRLFDETIKLFHTRHAAEAFPSLRKHELFATLFPQSDQALNSESGETYQQLFANAFLQTDERLNSGKHVSPAFLYALLLWPVVEQRIENGDTKEALNLRIMKAIRTTLQEQTKITAIPKRLQHFILDIWYLQYRLIRPGSKSIKRCLNSARFRAGYDLLVLRAQVNKQLAKTADWWTTYQASDEAQQQVLIEQRANQQF